ARGARRPARPRCGDAHHRPVPAAVPQPPGGGPLRPPGRIRRVRRLRLFHRLQARGLGPPGAVLLPRRQAGPRRGGEMMTSDTRTDIEAAVFRRLLKHLDDHKEVQNIDLMILADFCRNCLAKWYVAAAAERGETLDYEAAREIIYGMPYGEWKERFQAEATPEQLAALAARKS